MSTIINLAEYGEQIELTCRNHPHLRWQTKNIAPLGCRKIFFDLFHICNEAECDCPMNQLIPTNVPIQGDENE